ncbi:hypothetical protein [Kibdelosporangium aridum]|uniref:hypothetical protein n=1 Tax=Kibdelosporangium aridum TaxID=2030 RepID=UPI000F77096B|nr:hypothetical protein [Kibdelosporangium aridum]
MPNRALHFVGSVPAEVSAEPEGVMRWLLDGAGSHEITALPCENPRWIAPWLLDRRNVVDGDSAQEKRAVFEVVVDGVATMYDNVPLHRMARGVALRPEHVALGRVQQVAELMPGFRMLRAEHGQPRLRHQVSVPSPLDLALFTLASPKAAVGPVTKARAVAAALRHYGVFRDAVVGEVVELHDRFGDELVFQVEAPSVLVGLWSVPAPVRPLLARVLARQVADVLTRLPADASVVLHLCYGDLDHTSLVRPTSLKPAVLFLNALANLLRHRERERPAVHLPAAFGDQPPPVDTEYYQPLTRLDAGYPLYAGVADHRDPDVSRAALELFEAAAGRRTEAVSTACGLGREPLALATRAVAVCRTLTHARRPHAEDAALPPLLGTTEV